MPDFSLRGFGGRTESFGGNASTSRGTAVISSGSANTKGSYVEILASSKFDASGVYLTFEKPTSGSQDVLFDLAVGAAASEQDIVSNLYMGLRANGGGGIFFPILIPAGSRITGRCQSEGSSRTVFITGQLVGKAFSNVSPFGRVTTYGANTADSGGVQIDPGGVANTEGSYVEIVASTANPIRQLIIVVGVSGNGALANVSMQVDLAIGAAGSEQNIFDDYMIRGLSSSDEFRPAHGAPLSVSIPASTRLSARAQCDITEATDRLFDIAIYGLD